MAKNVLIIATSPRRNGNSNRLAQEFAKGAKNSRNNVEIVYLDDKKINFCKGCMACAKLKKCVIKDDVNIIVEKMQNSDVIVWATPVYYYNMSGQMKTMIDRSNPLYGLSNKFKEVYLLACAAENHPSAIDGTITGLKGWIACHSGVELKGVVRGLGVYEVGAIENKPVLKEAFEMGKNI